MRIVVNPSAGSAGGTFFFPKKIFKFSCNLFFFVLGMNQIQAVQVFGQRRCDRSPGADGWEEWSCRLFEKSGTLQRNGKIHHRMVKIMALRKEERDV